jgi:hypothetical protein
MRANELMRRLISGELANYSVVRTSPEPFQYSSTVTDLVSVSGDRLPLSHFQLGVRDLFMLR